VRASQGLDAASESVRKIRWVPRTPQCLLGNGLDVCKCVLDTMVKLIEQQPLRIRRLYTLRNVTEIADRAQVAVRKLNSVDSPLVIFHYAAIGADFGPLLCDVRLAGGQRVLEDADNFVGIVSFPHNVNYFAQIPPDETARNVSEHGERGRVDVPNSEIGVDQVDS